MNDAARLDVTVFVKALRSVNEALQERDKDLANTFVRDALIQRFEYSYELAHKMLKRYLEMTEPSAEEIDQMPFPTLIRTGAEKGLLNSSWESWSTYRHARNLTAHTYNESKAIEVCSVIPNFLRDAEYLLQQLQIRIAVK